MLYFYCCEINTGKKKIRVDGSMEVAKQITTYKEYNEAQNYLKWDLIMPYLKENDPNLSLEENISFSFLSFNPL